MSDDTSLDGITPDAPATDPTGPAGGVFGVPNPVTPDPEAPVRAWTIEEVLSMARRPQKRARICLRADYQAEHDQILAELATLVDADGELIDDTNGERAVGESSNAGRAQELGDRLTEVRSKMAGAMWFPLFEGMSSDDLAVFNKAHMPKTGDDLTDYNTLLISACSIEPAMSVEHVKSLRQTLGSAAMRQLRETAQWVCMQGGVDVPKLPGA